MSGKTLVVGCGLKPKAGCVNLDRVALPGVDVVFDLDTIDVAAKPNTRNKSAYECEWGPEILEAGSMPDKIPFLWDFFKFLPLPSQEFDRVEAEDVLEHVADVVAVVQEFGRVLRPGGTLWVRGPDAEWVWHDVTHRRAFSERSFDGFCPDTFDGKHYGHYHGSAKFRMTDKRHVNHGWEFAMVKLP